MRHLPGQALALAQRLSQLTSLMPLRDALRFLAGENRPECLTIGVNGLPVQLRGGTSDIPLFFDIFFSRALEIPFAVGDPKVIVDAGANIGLSTLYFAATYPSARIAALEPEPDNFAMLKRNCAVVPRIEPLCAALWSKDGNVALTDSRDGQPWAFTVGASGRNEIGTVEGISMPTLLQRLGAPIDILKIDIEGSERHVFSGDTSWLEQIGTLIIECHDRYEPGSAKAAYTALAPYNFRQEARGPNLFIALDPHRQ